MSRRILSIALPLDPPEQSLPLAGLANWAVRYSPLVAVDEPDGLLIDITGCQRLFRGERRLINLAMQELAEQGFAARAAIAATIGCAWAVTRFGNEPVSIISNGREREAIEPLPLNALRLDDETRAALEEVDLQAIGDVLRVPRGQLRTRFGPTILLRIDQALGQAFEPLEPIRPRVPLLVEREFAGPTTQTEAIKAAVVELIESLCSELKQRERGVRRLEVVLNRTDAEPLRLTLNFSRPSRDAGHLWTLLRPRIEAAHLGHGVDRIILHARSTQVIAHEQNASLERSRTAVNGEAQQRLGELIDIMAGRIGPQRIRRVELLESHLPECAYAHVPATQRSDHKQHDAPRAQQPMSLPRPSMLLDKPEAVTVVQSQGRPATLRRKGIGHALVSCIGPERIADAWWFEPKFRYGGGTRDYYRVQDDAGCWWWIFRECESGRWFLHGQWA